MATPEEQITPADAAIVTTGTGRKGPEEHDLPESLKYDMDLCLEILRNVLGEYNPELLSTFDTVRHYAVEASAEHFAELKDPNPDQDGLKEAVNVIDNMTLHDAQLLARAFATYFHLANLSEENYRVSVLHERENNVPVDQAVDPINELTVAYHQLINETGPAKAKELLNQLEFHPVFTAHPTEARRKAVEGKIRRVSELLEEYKRLGGSDKKECLRRLYNEKELGGVGGLFGGCAECVQRCRGGHLRERGESRPDQRPVDHAVDRQQRHDLGTAAQFHGAVRIGRQRSDGDHHLRSGQPRGTQIP